MHADGGCVAEVMTTIDDESEGANSIHVQSCFMSDENEAFV
jgi:hypothetical protein